LLPKLVHEAEHRKIERDVQLERQLGDIKALVQRDGGATVGCEQLRILCPDYLSISEQFMRIAQIAQRERWSFAFLQDGSVRFGSYAKP
jgi:hypothetical protein